MNAFWTKLMHDKPQTHKVHNGLGLGQVIVFLFIIYSIVFCISYIEMNQFWECGLFNSSKLVQFG
jgi:uncharacterized membrane protein YagU involved in acid resistance